MVQVWVKVGEVTARNKIYRDPLDWIKLTQPGICYPAIMLELHLLALTKLLTIYTTKLPYSMSTYLEKWT